MNVWLDESRRTETSPHDVDDETSPKQSPTKRVKTAPESVNMVGCPEEIHQVARSGVPITPWNELKQQVRDSIVACVEAFRHDKQDEREDIEARRGEILTMLDRFNEAPFTLQRICELCINPHAYNAHIDSLLCSFECLVSVSTTIAPVSLSEVQRLEEEYQRVVSSDLPGDVLKKKREEEDMLRRSGTLEMVD